MDAAVDAAPKLVLVAHNSQFTRARRMWNAAAVIAALRSNFPVSSRVHVVGWDIGLTTSRDVWLMT